MSEKTKIKKDEYGMLYICRNCGKQVTVAIKRGSEAPGYLREPCPNCGCEKLHKALN